MALAHRNPGYGMGVIGKYRDVKSANGGRGYPGAQGLKDMMDVPQDTLDLDNIRRSARDVWLKGDRNETSYQDHYRYRSGDVLEPTQARPTSANRKNKPHPPMVFLTNRLHSVPGYHNADTTIGKDAYRLDASLPVDEQDYRHHLREKYTSRPASGAVNQFKTIEELDVIHDPIERQGTDAWLKLAMAKDKENVLGHLREIKDSNAYQLTETIDITNRPRTVPSLHRYLKRAGRGEMHTLDNVYSHAANRGILEIRPASRARTPIDVVTMRKQDIDRTRSAHYNHRTKRGDFLLHPQWPPSIYHHRLNGLSSREEPMSSVDIPYMPGRR